ncbi:MAG: hypothetical protein ABF904_13615 [Ethanoligenens sp.]
MGKTSAQTFTIDPAYAFGKVGKEAVLSQTITFGIQFSGPIHFKEGVSKTDAEEMFHVYANSGDKKLLLVVPSCRADAKTYMYFEVDPATAIIGSSLLIKLKSNYMDDENFFAIRAANFAVEPARKLPDNLPLILGEDGSAAEWNPDIIKLSNSNLKSNPEAVVVPSGLHIARIACTAGDSTAGVRACSTFLITAKPRVRGMSWLKFSLGGPAPSTADFTSYCNIWGAVVKPPVMANHCFAIHSPRFFKDTPADYTEQICEVLVKSSAKFQWSGETKERLFTDAFSVEANVAGPGTLKVTKLEIRTGETIDIFQNDQVHNPRV